MIPHIEAPNHNEKHPRNSWNSTCIPQERRVWTDDTRRTYVDNLHDVDERSHDVIPNSRCHSYQGIYNHHDLCDDMNSQIHNQDL